MTGRVVALLLSAANLFLGFVKLPPLPAGQKLDLDKFALTWSDEFDGERLDPEKWGGHGFNTGAHRRGDAYWALEMGKVCDGKLHIQSAYLADGLAGGPPGYYTLGLDTSRSFRQKYGYFEARCKLPKGVGLWSAFWMYNERVGAADSAPQKGTEVDIYESAHYREGWPKKNSVSTALHYYDGGYGGTLHSQGVGRWLVSRPYDTFHTYGVAWNENEYIFYVDGRETARSAFGGVCQNELWLLLSVEHAFDGWAGDVRQNKEAMTDFVVDYVRVYQYKDKIQ